MEVLSGEMDWGLTPIQGGKSSGTSAAERISDIVDFWDNKPEWYRLLEPNQVQLANAGFSLNENDLTIAIEILFKKSESEKRTWFRRYLEKLVLEESLTDGQIQMACVMMAELENLGEDVKVLDEQLRRYF